MGRLIIGCCDWRFKDWVKGRKRVAAIYPKGVSTSGLLEIYAKSFGSVEVDQTGRGIMSDRTISHWVDSTPETFKFSLLLWKRITHANRLQNVTELFDKWITPLYELGPRLGAILIKIPSAMKIDQLEVFEEFLDTLPKRIRYAVEFRDPSWQTGRTLNALKKHQIAWASVYYPDEIQFLRFTGDMTYIRFHGAPKTYKRVDRLRGDPLPIFGKMVEQIKAAQQRGDTYIYVGNQLAGNAPHSISLLRGMLQLPNLQDTSTDERYVLAT